MIVEVPVARTPEKAQQVANTLVQHDVNTVEVERPQIIKQTWQKPIIQEKMNQVTKHVEVPLVQFLNKVDEIPVVAQRQILMVQTVQKTMEIPQLQCVDKVVVNPEAPQVQVSAKTVEISQLQAAEKIVETRETQTIQGIQTPESLDTAPFRQVHLAGAMKPDDPDAKIKFLVEETPHGGGGFIFDAHGNRVANELRERNCVTGEMWKNKPSFSLVLNKATSDDIALQGKQYTGRGVRKLHKSGTTLAEGMEAPVSKMPDSIEAHCQPSLKSAMDPDGEPYPAFASEKSGKKLLARQAQRRNSTITSVREQISQHSPSVLQSTWSWPQ